LWYQFLQYALLIPALFFHSNSDDLPRNLSLICLLLQLNGVPNNFLSTIGAGMLWAIPEMHEAAC
jgi:hypothetical protein